MTIELVPGGTGTPRMLGAIAIANTGGTPAVGNYRYELFDAGGRSYRAGSVSGFPRRRLLGFDLLFRVLRDAIGPRNT